MRRGERCFPLCAQVGERDERCHADSRGSVAAQEDRRAINKGDRRFRAVPLRHIKQQANPHIPALRCRSVSPAAIPPTLRVQRQHSIRAANPPADDEQDLSTRSPRVTLHHSGRTRYVLSPWPSLSSVRDAELAICAAQYCSRALGTGQVSVLPVRPYGSRSLVRERCPWARPSG
jgi:hypothetical protein